MMRGVCVKMSVDSPTDLGAHICGASEYNKAGRVALFFLRVPYSMKTRGAKKKRR